MMARTKRSDRAEQLRAEREAEVAEKDAARALRYVAPPRPDPKPKRGKPAKPRA